HCWCRPFLCRHHRQHSDVIEHGRREGAVSLVARRPAAAPWALPSLRRGPSSVRGSQPANAPPTIEGTDPPILDHKHVERSALAMSRSTGVHAARPNGEEAAPPSTALREELGRLRAVLVYQLCRPAHRHGNGLAGFSWLVI